MARQSSDRTRRPSPRPSKKVIREFNDRGTLWLLEDPANLRDLLRLLAPDLVDALDFSRAEPVPRTFIPADLRKRESDLLVAIPFRGEAGGEVWVYILLEHQSRPDRWMPLRLFLYMAQIWDLQRRRWTDANVPEEERWLRPIIPVVFYTGTERWSAPLSLATLMRLPEALERFVPRWETLWLGLQETPPETLAQLASALGWAMRALQASEAPLPEMERVLAEAMAGLEGLTDEQAGQWERAAWYLVLLVLYQREEPALAEKLVLQARASEFGLGKEVARMGRSIIQQAEDKGESRGIRQSLIRVLTLRYGPVPVEVAVALEQADVATLNAWLESAVTAPSLEEVGILPRGQEN